MNRTRATFLLAAVAVASLSTTGCHRHRVARGAYPVTAYPAQVAYQPQMMMAPQPIVIVVETRGAAAPDADYAQEAAAQEAAAREEAGREAAARAEAKRRAWIEREQAERARIAQERAERAERARIAQEQAARDAQARAAAAQGQTTIIVVGPGGAQPVRINNWFEGQ